MDGMKVKEAHRGIRSACTLLRIYTRDRSPIRIYRTWIMVGLLKEMLNQSRYPEIKFLLHTLKDHPVSEGIGC